MIISCGFLLKVRYVSETFVEKIKTHDLCSITFFQSRAFYEIMWKNIIGPGRPLATIKYGPCALHAG